MILIAYAFEGQMHMFAGQVKVARHHPCRTGAIFKYFCPTIHLYFDSEVAGRLEIPCYIRFTAELPMIERLKPLL